VVALQRKHGLGVRALFFEKVVDVKPIALMEWKRKAKEISLVVSWFCLIGICFLFFEYPANFNHINLSIVVVISVLNLFASHKINRIDKFVCDAMSWLRREARLVSCRNTKDTWMEDLEDELNGQAWGIKTEIDTCNMYPMSVKNVEAKDPT
jgi:hypothetical protein